MSDLPPEVITFFAVLTVVCISLLSLILMLHGVGAYCSSRRPFGRPSTWPPAPETTFYLLDTSTFWMLLLVILKKKKQRAKGR